MAKLAALHPDWKDVDWLDLEPGPGCFVSPERKDYTVHGAVVNALNWLHALHVWARREVEANGEEFGRCCHCNQPIRYAVIFEDGEKRHHMVGERCAKFISSHLNRTNWDEQRRYTKIKTINTKNGERAVLSFEAPSWYWSIPREERPRFCSISKYEKPFSRTPAVWYLSVWGETPAEVLTNWETLQTLKK